MASFPSWTYSQTPIPGVSLSAAGLLALADLSTVAQRTAITGGAMWLDILILVPGLHYQQAADELGRARGGESAVVDATESHSGRRMSFKIKNAATALFIQRVARAGETVILDVGVVPGLSAGWFPGLSITTRYRLRRSDSGMHATVWPMDGLPDLGWVSHLLYLISPVLTIAALVFVILFRDWWTLGSLLSLMLSRTLNIWVIKQRSKRPPNEVTNPPVEEDANDDDNPSRSNNNENNQSSRLTEYTISLGDGHSSSSSVIRLRGMPDDLLAITAHAWLRSKTHVEGYLEATAKLLVYMVAAFSGNTTQVGSIIMMGLLLVTAGLLALSNANAKSLSVNGRVAVPERFVKKTTERGGKEKKKMEGSRREQYGGVGGGGESGKYDGVIMVKSPYAATNAQTSESDGNQVLERRDSLAEKGQVGIV